MKTRQPDERTTPGLPPPPAPTARDANPWPLSKSAQPARPGPEAGLGSVLRKARTVPAARRRRNRLVPALVLFTVLGIGAGLAVEALRSGKVEDAIGGLLVLAFVALTAWRALRNRE